MLISGRRLQRFPPPGPSASPTLFRLVRFGRVQCPGG